MATKTFSGRADEKRLADAEARARRDFGVSFGTYCGTILLDVMEDAGSLPRPDADRDRMEQRRQAWEAMKARSAEFKGSPVTRMSDEEIKDLIAERYL